MSGAPNQGQQGMPQQGMPQRMQGMPQGMPQGLGRPVSAGQPFQGGMMPQPGTQAFRGGMSANMPSLQGLPQFQSGIPSQPSTGQFVQQYQAQQAQKAAMPGGMPQGYNRDDPFNQGSGLGGGG